MGWGSTKDAACDRNGPGDVCGERSSGCDTARRGGDKGPLSSLDAHKGCSLLLIQALAQLLPAFPLGICRSGGAELTWGELRRAPAGPLKESSGHKLPVGANLRANILLLMEHTLEEVSLLITMPEGMGSCIITLRIFINIF